MNNLKDVICLVFCHISSPRPLSLLKIKQALACYLGIKIVDINDDEVIQALRECSFAVPHVKTRGTVLINWSFDWSSLQSGKTTKKIKKSKRKWREKPINESLKLKSS